VARGSQVSRQLQILRLLARDGSVRLPTSLSGEQLLGVCWRTVRRDLAQLIEIGAPVAVTGDRAYATGDLAAWILGGSS